MDLPKYKTDKEFMLLALEEAFRAKGLGEVPIGAILVGKEGEIISRTHNLRETNRDPTAHAEILAIREGAKKLGGWRLFGTTLYVTLEPCPMCMGAIVLARVKRIVFGCRDPKAGALVSLYTIGVDLKLNHRVEVEEGVLREKCEKVLKEFFKEIRKK